ncbi:MAG: hypothetical protein GOP50_11420 [Candidatus Heimdallarchaeota archaeon]|nr:hypothetical protein [Candidatus Heimdallarchaeota archaeon]
MKRKTLLLRILFDLGGSLIGAGLAYFAFFIVGAINSISQWEQIIGFVVLLVASGFVVGFFAFKKDGIFLAGFIGLVFLVILTIYGVLGIGLYEVLPNYALTLILSIVEGIIFFCVPVLAAFLGGILTPTLWQYSKKEIHEIKDAVIVKKDEEKLIEKIYCKTCGSEVPRHSRACIICGKKV